MVFSNWWGILAPAGTPEPVLARLRQASAEMARDPSFIEKIGKLGYQPTHLEGDAFRSFVIKDFGQWKDVAKSANISITD